MIAGSCALMAILLAQNAPKTGASEQVSDALDAFWERDAYDTLLQVTAQGLTQSAALKDWKTFTLYSRYRIKTLNAQDSLEQSLLCAQQSLKTLEQDGQGNSLFAAELWMRKALTHRNLEELRAGLECYENAIRIYEKNKVNDPYLAFCYKNAAQVYIRRAEHKKAGDYLLAAIRSDSTETHLPSIYSQIANNYYWQDSLSAAEKYFRLGTALAESKGNSLAALHMTGAAVFEKKGAWEQSEQLIAKALEYYRQDPDEVDNRMRCYSLLASIAIKKGRPNHAAMFFEQAEKEGRAYFKGPNREMAILYCHWGDFLQTTRTGLDPLELYQKALREAWPEYQPQTSEKLPAPETTPLEQWAAVAAARIAENLIQNQQATNAQRSLAADYFDLAFSASDRLLYSYGADESKLYFMERNFDIVQAAVENLAELALQNPTDPAPRRRLFEFLENRRATVLRSALEAQRNFALSELPESQREREDALRNDLLKTIGELNIEKSKRADSATLAQLDKERFRIETELQELRQSLEKQYPIFTQFNKAGRARTVADIAAAMPDTALVLSFFDTEKNYLCLTLNKQEQVQLYRIPKDSVFMAQLLAMVAMLSDKQAQEQAPQQYFKLAYAVKQQLLPAGISANAKHLIVVPDGILSNLPFEALLSQAHQGTYADAPYLLREFTLQYTWSATMLCNSDVATKASGNNLHIAPFGRETRSGLGLLAFSTEEQAENATSLHGSSASLTRVWTEAPRYRVLHFSTHAQAGNASETGIELWEQRVSLAQLYTLRLNADLVCLSACETNKGAYAKGEGVLSLAHAFAYAGARALIATHWKINDRASARLMQSFYDETDKKLSLTQALRQAKINWLRSSEPDARKMPYYWAAFTLSGRDTTLSPESIYLIPALIGLLLLSVGGFWFWRRKLSR